MRKPFARITGVVVSYQGLTTRPFPIVRLFPCLDGSKMPATTPSRPRTFTTLMANAGIRSIKVHETEETERREAQQRDMPRQHRTSKTRKDSKRAAKGTSMSSRPRVGTH